MTIEGGREHSNKSELSKVSLAFTLLDREERMRAEHLAERVITDVNSTVGAFGKPGEAILTRSWPKDPSLMHSVISEGRHVLPIIQVKIGEGEVPLRLVAEYSEPGDGLGKEVVNSVTLEEFTGGDIFVPLLYINARGGRPGDFKSDPETLPPYDELRRGATLIERTIAAYVDSKLPRTTRLMYPFDPQAE
jgi:hypothetical protein